MNCPYCRASNMPDEPRCQRCGRRLETQDSYDRRPYGRGAAAPALRYATAPVQEEVSQRRSQPFQPGLFTNRIVSFESYAPETVEPKSRPAKPAGRPRHKRPAPGQESFPFETVISQADFGPKTDPQILCEAHVAGHMHRLVASAIDLSIVIISVALFVLVLRLATEVPLSLNPHTAPVACGMLAMFYLMYEIMWCMANTDSAGMQWVRLRVVNFDGNPPDREQRLIRVASGCLSLLAAGLGVLWALVDEDTLTWHDHISKSFPTTV